MHDLQKSMSTVTVSIIWKASSSVNGCAAHLQRLDTTKSLAMALERVHAFRVAFFTMQVPFLDVHGFLTHALEKQRWVNHASDGCMVAIYMFEKITNSVHSMANWS